MAYTSMGLPVWLSAIFGSKGLRCAPYRATIRVTLKLNWGRRGPVETKSVI